MNFPEYLLSIGYLPYRFIIKSNWNKESKSQAKKIITERVDLLTFIVEDIKSDIIECYNPIEFNTTYLNHNFNSMENGGITVRFVKDKDFNNHICFGLSDFGKQPTLIYPRPKGILDDDQMNEILAKEDFEQLMKDIII